MELLYQHLSTGVGATRAELTDKFVPLSAGDQAGKTDVLYAALDGMQTLGLVREAASDNGSCFLQVGAPVGNTFPVMLLSALRSANPRQAAFIRLYEWCVRNRVRDISHEELLNSARQHVEIDAQWTHDKIRFWASLAAFVGIVIQHRGGSVIAPTPAGLVAWIEAVSGARETWAGEVFNHIDGHLAPCFATSGRLHPGWASTLDLLHRRRQVLLRTGSDAPIVLRAKLSSGGVWSRIGLPGN